MKNNYDGHPSLYVIFTGSSVLDLLKGQADLSRRAVMYNMQGLSFREYLEMVHGIKMPKYTLEEVIDNKVDDTILPHPLPLFRQCLQDGYYPYSKEGLSNHVSTRSLRRLWSLTYRNTHHCRSPLGENCAD